MEKTDFNSCVNQDIKGQFIGREVYCCASTMVNELIRANTLDSELGFDLWSYLESYGTYEGEELTESERDEKIEELEEKIEDIEYIVDYYDPAIDFGYTEEQLKDIEIKQDKGNSLIEKLEAIIEELQGMDFDEYPEVYEYWLVSDHLGRKLKAHGQVIISDYNCSIWGRQTSGQAILLDYVISQICDEMEILDGQKFSWKKD